MDIYQRIQDLAKQKRISIRQIETDLNFANGTIRRWHTSAPIDKLTKVANYLGTTVDYLVLGHLEKPVKETPKRVDLEQQMNDDYTIMAWGGRQISDQEREMIRRLLDGGK